MAAASRAKAKAKRSKAKPKLKLKKRAAPKKTARGKAAKRAPARKAKPAAPVKLARHIHVTSGPPPIPKDAVELSGVYGRVMYSENDPYAEVREVFDRYDRNKSGLIEAREFARVCEALGMEIDEEELTAGIEQLDSDRDGKISWDEFAGWWRSTGS
jgi:hypothetical protein